MTSKAMEHLNLTEEQIALLEDNYKKHSKHPDGTTLMLIAAEVGLSEEETQVSGDFYAFLIKNVDQCKYAV